MPVICRGDGIYIHIYIYNNIGYINAIWDWQDGRVGDFCASEVEEGGV